MPFVARALNAIGKSWIIMSAHDSYGAALRALGKVSS